MKAALCEGTAEALIKLCESRNLRCKGCPYSIRKLLPDYQGGTVCIFGNLPFSWDPQDQDN